MPETFLCGAFDSKEVVSIEGWGGMLMEPCAQHMPYSVPCGGSPRLAHQPMSLLPYVLASKLCMSGAAREMRGAGGVCRE